MQNYNVFHILCELYETDIHIIQQKMAKQVNNHYSIIADSNIALYTNKILQEYMTCTSRL